MTDEYNANASYSSGEWLVKYYSEHGDAKTALKFAEAGFLQRSWLPNYQRIQQLAEPIGSWPKVRSRLLKQLMEKKQWQLLVEIAIHEQDGNQALKPLKNLPTYQQSKFQLAIAQVCEPTVAIAIYEELVHTTIQRKHRSAYQEAARYLQSIQKLQKLPKTAKDWKQYIQRIRDQYPTLKALHSELDRL
jgi:uncharacterized Zn finger protein